jgi:xyloglucan 6-xylosyltransferase
VGGQGVPAFLESSYLLHGFWEGIVDRYVEMRSKWRPGLGDDRWPLVTHFVGCKPCGGHGASYDADMNACLGDFGLARLYDHGQWRRTKRI